jgi:membrane protein YqaA with SNARE-associated domain
MPIKLSREATDLILAILISLVSFAIFLLIPSSWFAGPLGILGYAAGFFLALVSSATILLPGTILPTIAAMGLYYNPVVLGLLCGLGSALGELTGYCLGYYGRATFNINGKIPEFERQKKWLQEFEFVFLFIVACIPNPFFDIAGIASGTLKIPVWRFLIPVFIGKAIKYGLTAYMGLSVWNWAIGA